MKKDIEIFIKRYCKSKNISQKKFSEKTGIPFSTVKSYVNSKFNPTTENIKKIEKSLKLNLSFLLLDSEVFNLQTVEGIKNILEKSLYDTFRYDNEAIENTENILLDILRNLEMQNFINEEKNKKNELIENFEIEFLGTHTEGLHQILKFLILNFLEFENIVIKDNNYNEFFDEANEFIYFVLDNGKKYKINIQDFFNELKPFLLYLIEKNNIENKENK